MDGKQLQKLQTQPASTPSVERKGVPLLHFVHHCLSFDMQARNWIPKARQSGWTQRRTYCIIGQTLLLLLFTLYGWTDYSMPPSSAVALDQTYEKRIVATSTTRPSPGSQNVTHYASVADPSRAGSLPSAATNNGSKKAHVFGGPSNPIDILLNGKGKPTTPGQDPVVYPLESLNLSSATAYYRRGFWQRMDPVPIKHWNRSSARTCLFHESTTLEKWQRKIPHGVILGTQKGGTTALAYYLYNHPNIPYFPTKELRYFDEVLDQLPSTKTKAIFPTADTMSAAALLDFYHKEIIHPTVPLVKFELETKYAIDATPNYLFASDRVPQRLLCSAPWAKLVILLRNPVDRAYSHYHMQLQRDLKHPELRRPGQSFTSFEDAVDLDLAVLQETGVIQADQSPVKNPELEAKAWGTYTKLGVNSVVGRGFYSIQLKQWIEAFKDYQKPLDDLLVIPSERLFADPNATYQEIVHFLGLEPHQIPKYSKVHATTYRNPNMLPETRVKLESIFSPYNQELAGLLGNSWKGVWERTGEKE